MTPDEKLLQLAIDRLLPNSVFSADNIQASVAKIEEVVDKASESTEPQTLRRPSVSSLIKKFIPTIPEKVIPSPADLQEFADKKISELKLKTQHTVNNKQLLDAKKAELAFTQRKIRKPAIRKPLTGS